MCHLSVQWEGQHVPSFHVILIGMGYTFLNMERNTTNKIFRDYFMLNTEAPDKGFSPDGIFIFVQTKNVLKSCVAAKTIFLK